MDSKNKHTRLKPILLPLLLGVILSGLGFLVMRMAAAVPGFADRYYESVYVRLENTIARLSGLFPFSLVEAGLYIAILLLLFFLCRLIFRIIRHKDGRKGIFYHTAHFISGLVLFAGILFFLYAFCCGTNYRKTSFADMAGIPLDLYTPQELLDTCVYLTQELIDLEPAIAREEDGTMLLSKDAKTYAHDVMANLGQTYPFLSGYYPNPKGLMVSRILSVQSLSGVYSPFTIEANYNNEMTDYNIPFTMCHELSHLKGFMQEEEANFIAYLACEQSDLPEYRYSGLMLGWTYCTNELYNLNKDIYYQLRAYLPSGVEADLKANTEFWDRFEDKTISDVHEKLNDAYLKGNGQTHGVASYDMVTGLIVRYYHPHES